MTDVASLPSKIRNAYYQRLHKVDQYLDREWQRERMRTLRPDLVKAKLAAIRQEQEHRAMTDATSWADAERKRTGAERILTEHRQACPSCQAAESGSCALAVELAAEVATQAQRARLAWAGLGYKPRPR